MRMGRLPSKPATPSSSSQANLTSSSMTVRRLILYVVPDNAIGESTYYPDSKKWGIRSPERRLIRSEALEYYDGEE